MDKFFTLYQYELKKIGKKKLVWITMGILILISVFMATREAFTYQSMTISGEQISMRGLEYINNKKVNGMKLDGRAIDDVLLEEVKAAYINGYQKSSQVTGKPGLNSDYSRQTAGSYFSDDKEELENQALYEAIYDYIGSVVGLYETNHEIHTITEEKLYQSRTDKLLSYWEQQRLAESEKTYWQKQEEKLEKPFIYGYARGWFRMIEELFYFSFLMILGITICLSTVFSDEHIRRMDQLILCSRYGKKYLFLVKMAAGITFGAGGAILIFLSALTAALGVYGTEGFNTMLQIYLPLCSRNLTVGQAVLSMAGIYLVSSVVFCILTMFLSEVMKNSVAAMGMIIGGMILITFFNIPPQYRVISQIYGLLISMQQAGGHLMDNRLVNLFGIQFRNEEMVLMICLGMSLLLLFLGNHIYRNCQVRGR